MAAARVGRKLGFHLNPPHAETHVRHSRARFKARRKTARIATHSPRGRALGREEWLRTIATVATINPLSMPRRSARPRQRATGKIMKSARL